MENKIFCHIHYLCIFLIFQKDVLPLESFSIKWIKIMNSCLNIVFILIIYHKFYTFIDHSNFLFQEAATAGVLWKKVFLEISQNSQENTCGRVSFLITLPETLLRKRLWHKRFPVNFAKFLRTSILQNTSGRLLLYFNIFSRVFRFTGFRFLTFHFDFDFPR